jgi:hypothetical protein
MSPGPNHRAGPGRAAVADMLLEDPGLDMATLSTPVADAAAALDTGVVKVSLRLPLSPHFPLYYVRFHFPFHVQGPLSRPSCTSLFTSRSRPFYVLFHAPFSPDDVVKDLR